MAQVVAFPKNSKEQYIAVLTRKELNALNMMLRSRGASERSIGYANEWADSTVANRVSFLRRYADIDWHIRGTSKIYKARLHHNVIIQESVS